MPYAHGLQSATRFDARTGSIDCLNCRRAGGYGQLSKFLAQDTVAPQAIANPEPYHQESWWKAW